jgi:hypothetical protein
MKRFSLFSLVALVFAVVYACSESTTPPESSSLMTPKDPSRNVFGDPPPPPVETAVVVCAGGTCVEVDGTYMANATVASNGRRATFAATFAANPAGEGVCPLPGTAWLRFSKNSPPQTFDVTTSANGRIKCSHQIATGRGTIEFAGWVVHLDQVLNFNNVGDCSTFCGDFTATATNGDETVTARGEIFNRAFFDEFCQITEGGVFCGEG